MLKIFHAPGSRSTRVVWLCEEMSVPYQIEPASFQNPTPEFRAASPLNAIPAVIDGASPPMIESIAIMLYIAGKHGPTDLVLRPDEAEFGRYLQFLVLSEAAMGSEVNAIIGARFMAPDEHKNNWSVARCEQRLEAAFDFLARELNGRAFIAGDRFTMADIACAHATGVAAQFLGYADKFPKALMDYHARMTARPAYKRASA